jgi:hypothetical protein
VYLNRGPTLSTKLQSVFLAAIMLVGSISFAFPEFIPEAFTDHNPNLFVSAENPAFLNHFGGGVSEKK